MSKMKNQKLFFKVEGLCHFFIKKANLINCMIVWAFFVKNIEASPNVIKTLVLRLLSKMSTYKLQSKSKIQIAEKVTGLQL